MAESKVSQGSKWWHRGLSTTQRTQAEAGASQQQTNEHSSGLLESCQNHEGPPCGSAAGQGVSSPSTQGATQQHPPSVGHSHQQDETQRFLLVSGDFRTFHIAFAHPHKQGCCKVVPSWLVRWLRGRGRKVLHPTGVCVPVAAVAGRKRER